MTSAPLTHADIRARYLLTAEWLIAEENRLLRELQHVARARQEIRVLLYDLDREGGR